MWFRALRPYRLPNRLGIDAEELERRLQTRTFSACTPAQATSMGWVPALADTASALVHAAGPFWMVRLKREEKLLPATVVREEASERCAQIAKAQGRKVSRRERLAVADEVTQDLLPRAFSRSSTIRAIIADQLGWIWIDSSSAGRSEEVLNHLREALGSLPAVLAETQKAPAYVMTQWLLHGGLPEAIELAEEADFVDQREAGSSVKVRGVPLDSEEVLAHISSGHQVEKLALEWGARVAAVVDKDLSLRRLRFSDAIREANDELIEDPLARADADFMILCEIIKGLQGDLLNAFGGIAE
ncbi:MAG: recombination-associated protein RdgC [Luminiphilus sp.]|jgi:recombination associated protein RdgC|nr:recombination-associated protein RdgC [Luminiphilus sp.]MBL6897109.1 recombination-associated protein RdgC [Luminiphilus sp.]MDB2365100.1 recombination-associated protein RdgC [Luminiphilus sp.]MDC0573514.1 recombination-associated protein RdgC [Luminiphilus sp.]MDC1160824.1 recombination-associated protein RdgC [Luminiphilus sp.]